VTASAEETKTVVFLTGGDYDDDDDAAFSNYRKKSDDHDDDVESKLGAFVQRLNHAPPLHMFSYISKNDAKEQNSSSNCRGQIGSSSPQPQPRYDRKKMGGNVAETLLPRIALLEEFQKSVDPNRRRQSKNGYVVNK